MTRKHNDLLVGQIGSGGRGANLGRLAHRPGRGSRIVACCDVNAATLAQNRRDFGSDTFVTSDYRELLAQDIDAVLIATPDFCHEEQAVAALELGLAVFLEKPMALTTVGCDRILRTAHRHRARLYLGHNMRHMPFVRKMKALIDDGAIGEVKACWVRHFVGHGIDFYYRDWHAERRYVTGLLLQKGAHDIDIIHWLCGDYSRRVSAFGALTLADQLPGRLTARLGPRQVTTEDVDFTLFPPTKHRRLNHRIEVEDLSTVQMQLQNGVLATYAQCMYTPDYWRSYTVIGSEGRLENFGNGERGTEIQVWKRRHPGYSRRGDATYRIPVTSGTHGGADPLLVDEFIRFAREGGGTETSPLAAREAVATACAATTSLRSGGIPQRVVEVAASTRRWFREQR
jgi:predicted dehydrogenase